MQSPNNADAPEEHPRLKINLAKELIGWKKREQSFRKRVLPGILLVVCIPLLPILLPVGLVLYLISKYKEYREKTAVQNGILPNELSASGKSIAYLSSRDVKFFLGSIDIEYTKSAEKASFNSQSRKSRYTVYGTREEGLFMLIPKYREIEFEGSKCVCYYQCEVVRVHGGYNHGDFGETSPLGSNDCVVLVYKKVSKVRPRRDLIIIR